MIYNNTIYSSINANKKRRGFLRKSNTLNKDLRLKTESNTKIKKEQIFNFIFDKDKENKENNNNNDSIKSIKY
jgi:hypothetical protein